MSKVERMSAQAAEVEFNKTPLRSKGKWVELLKELHANNQGAIVKDMSRGGAYGLARACKDKGFTARTTDKGTTVIIVPPAKKTPVPK